MDTVQSFTIDMIFMVVTMGTLLLKVFIFWELLALLIIVNNRLRRLWEGKS